MPTNRLENWLVLAFFHASCQDAKDLNWRVNRRPWHTKREASRLSPARLSCFRGWSDALSDALPLIFTTLVHFVVSIVLRAGVVLVLIDLLGKPSAGHCITEGTCHPDVSDFSGA